MLPACGQSVYPDRPVRAIIPIRPAPAPIQRSINDRDAIAHAEPTIRHKTLRRRRWQLGAEAVARTQPDGYMLPWTPKRLLVVLPIWFGVCVPASTPRPIVERLHSEIARLAGDDALRAKLAAAIRLYKQIDALEPLKARLVRQTAAPGNLDRRASVVLVSGDAAPRGSSVRPDLAVPLCR
jgi:hypothetical protein